MRDLVVRQIEKVAHQTPHDGAVAHDHGGHAQALELKDHRLEAVNDVQVGFAARVSKPGQRQTTRGRMCHKNLQMNANVTNIAMSEYIRETNRRI